MLVLEQIIKTFIRCAQALWHAFFVGCFFPKLVMDQFFNFRLAMAGHPMTVTDIFQDRALGAAHIENKRATGMKMAPCRWI